MIYRSQIDYTIIEHIIQDPNISCINQIYYTIIQYIYIYIYYAIINILRKTCTYYTRAKYVIQEPHIVYLHAMQCNASSVCQMSLVPQSTTLEKIDSELVHINIISVTAFDEYSNHLLHSSFRICFLLLVLDLHSYS